jgi:hypothetical protein
MAGYPRVVGYVAGGGYVAGHYPGTGIYGADPAPMPPPHPMLQHPQHAQHAQHHQMMQHVQHGALPVHGPAGPEVQSPPWRPMMAPGSPPLGEGHVFMPLSPETFNGSWGNTAAGGAPPGTVITFSARPQKPFKSTRFIVNATKSGATAIGRLVGQVFVGTDLQQGELVNVDLESIGAATAFDTWVSMKQAEPGVWIRVQSTLTAFPTTTDFETYTISVIGHYLH